MPQGPRRHGVTFNPTYEEVISDSNQQRGAAVSGGSGGGRALEGSRISNSVSSFGHSQPQQTWTPATFSSSSSYPFQGRSQLSTDQQQLLERLSGNHSHYSGDQEPPNPEMRSAVSMAANQQQMMQQFQHQQHNQLLQLQSQQPHPSQLPTLNPPPLIPMSAHLSPKQQQAPTSSTDALRKTVSPQEAFLDYEDVDTALHANPRYNSSFGVGVGTTRGTSFFAPLPALAAQYQRHSSPASSDSFSHSNQDGQRREAPPLTPSHLHHQVPTSPIPRGSPPPSAFVRASSLPPGSAGSVATASAVRYGSRFAVPRNAVSWEDSHAVGEDEEEDDSEEVDEESDAVIVKGFLPLLPVRRDEEKEMSEDEDEEEVRTPAEIQSVDLGDRQHAPPQAEEKEVQVMASLPPLPQSPIVNSPANSHRRQPSGSPAIDTPPRAPSAPAPTPPTMVLPPLPSHAVPTNTRPSRLSTSSTTRPRPPVIDFDDEDEDSEMKAKTTEEDSGEEDDSDEYVPAASVPTGSGSGSGSRKRSRGPTVYAEDNSDDSDEFTDGGAEDEDAFEDEDEDRPRKSKASGGGGGGGGRRSGGPTLPNKRRRRAPPTSSMIPTSSSAIRCMHQYSDGTFCGVIFRRPYDLARHKETIHGEGGKAKKDWVCAECKGSFSRKDALIRHARIRNHEAGV